VILKIILATSNRFCVFKGAFRVSQTNNYYSLKVNFVANYVSRMVFEGGILGSMQNIWAI